MQLMKFYLGKLEAGVSSSVRKEASDTSSRHWPAATGRWILTGAFKLLNRGKCSRALAVPAQASSCREVFPQDVLNSLKLCYAKLFLEVSAAAAPGA